MSALSFLGAMQRAGFVEHPEWREAGILHVFTHPDVANRRFVMVFGQVYGATLTRFTDELRRATDACPSGGARLAAHAQSSRRRMEQ
jgi:hypothetical protein